MIVKLKDDNANIYIIKANKGDLSEILDLQYFAYQSEARLFDDEDISPLKQTLVDVENEYQRGRWKTVQADLFENNSVRAVCVVHPCSAVLQTEGESGH